MPRGLPRALVADRRIDRGSGPTSVGPPSADLIRPSPRPEASPANGTYHSRAVVALAPVSRRSELLARSGILGRRGGRSRSTRRCPAGGSRSSVLTGASSPSTNTVSDVTFVGSSLSNTIFQTRPFEDWKFGVSTACRVTPPASTRVDDVDDVRHPGALVVGDVLDAHELEHVVDVAPVLEHPLRPVDARRRDDGYEDLAASDPFVGGAGNPTSAGFSSEPSALRPVAMFFGTLTKCPATVVPEPGVTS